MTSTTANPDPKQWDMKEHFNKQAATYERQAGGLTRKVSKHLIALSEPPLSSTSVVLDNATGPGITCTEILRQLPEADWPREIHATDLSEAMIEQVRKQGYPQIEAQAMDARELKFPDGKFSHIYMAFIIFALDAPERAARELYRTLQPGGAAYVTSWKGLGWAKPVDRALRRVRPDQPPYRGPITEEWFKAETLKSCLLAGGFKEGNVEVHDFESRVQPDFWDSATEFIESGVMNPIIGSWSTDEKSRFVEYVKEEVTKDKETGELVEMPCWVAVARK